MVNQPSAILVFPLSLPSPSLNFNFNIDAFYEDIVGGNETLVLERPLKGFYQIGASVEANAANTGSVEDCTNEALGFPLFSIVTDMTVCLFLVTWKIINYIKY